MPHIHWRCFRTLVLHVFLAIAVVAATPITTLAVPGYRLDTVTQRLLTEYGRPGEQIFAIEPPLVDGNAVYHVYYFTTGRYTLTDSSFFFRASATFFSENRITGLLVTRNDVVVEDEAVIRQIFTLYMVAHQLYRAVKVDELGSVPMDFNRDLSAITGNPIFRTLQLGALLKSREAQTAEALRAMLTNQGRQSDAVQLADKTIVRLKLGNNFIDSVEWALKEARFSNNKTARDTANVVRNFFKRWKHVTQQGKSYIDLAPEWRLEFFNALDLVSLAIQLSWMAQLQRERAEWLDIYQSAFPRGSGALDAEQHKAASTVRVEAEDAWVQRSNIILGFARDRLVGALRLSSEKLAEAWVKWSWQKFGQRTTGHLVGSAASAVFLGGTLGNLLYGVDDLFDNFRKAERANELRQRFNQGRRTLEQKAISQTRNAYDVNLATQYRAAYMLESLAAAQTLRSYADGVAATYRLPNPVTLINWLRNENWAEAVASLRDLADRAELDAEETVGHPLFVDLAMGLMRDRLVSADAIVITDALNVRFGPDTSYNRIGGVNKDNSLTVIGRNKDCSWVQVITPTGIQGWVAAGPQYIKLNLACNAIPVVDVVSPQPSPTPTTSVISIEILNVEYLFQVAPGQQFRPKVTVRVNTGQLLDVNTRGDMLRNTDGNLFGAHPHVAVDRTVNAGEEYTFTFYEDKPITAPDQEGTYESKWRLSVGGNWVGPEITIRFQVRRNTPPTPFPPATPFPPPSEYVCGQFIRLTQSIDQAPAFQPYGTNEVWVIAPTEFFYLEEIFQEGIFVTIKKPDFGDEQEPAWGYTRVRYLIDSADEIVVPNCESSSGSPPDISQIKQDILSQLGDAVVSTDYPQQAEQLVNTLFVHLGDFGQNGGSVSQDNVLQALQGEEVSLRLNATVQGVWGIWAERGQHEGFDPTSTDPGLFPDLSPFRRLIIRLIQENQGSLSAAEQHAFYSLLTRSEDLETWSNDMNAIVGAINRENFPNEQPAPTPMLIPPPQPPIASVALEMITIPAGNFTMGSSDADIQSVVSECNGVEGNCQEAWFGGEKPARTVFVDTFNISKYEVTNAQYNACVNAGICGVAGRNITDDNITSNPGFFADNLPVVGISWQDASTFCNWLGGRLPTEVEWEKAARGSGDQRRYPWGSDYDPSRANLSSGYPTAVGRYPGGASPYGIMDMAGNVFEWTATVDGDKYILRGGGWNNYYYRGRVTDRGTKLPPSFANYDIGFRCASR